MGSHQFLYLMLLLVSIFSHLSINAEAQDFGNCKNGTLCAPGFCCSNYYYCGTNGSYCGVDTCRSQCPTRGQTGSTDVGVIVGSVAGGVGGLLLIAVSACFLCRRRRQKKGDLERETSTTALRKGSATDSVEGLRRTADSGEGLRRWTEFSLDEVKKITKNFERQIGKGGFGPVYHGILDDGSQVAVKVNSETSDQGRIEFSMEVRILSRIHHRNLVELLGFCDENNQRILVYALMEAGTLQNHLYGMRKGRDAALDWPTRLQIAIDAARGLEYLHNDCHPQIIHRDVKSNNILLTEELQAKLIDFGISKVQKDSTNDAMTTAVKGTFGYLDPEYFYSNQLTCKSDVYSYGIVLLEIICGRPPFYRNPGEEQYSTLKNYVGQMLSVNKLEAVVDEAIRGNYDNEAMWEVIDLAMRCVNQQSIDRPSMRQVVKELDEIRERFGIWPESSVGSPSSFKIQLEAFYEDTDVLSVNPTPR